ncbi:MAG TPA: isochorismatase family cysteine hydrolase [Trebonia sp.]|nr:isochorismatase family cysteine hydrolase [Trebonia sp.]
MATAAAPRGRHALLLIDFQRDFLAGDGRMPVARHQVTGVLVATGRVITQATADGDLIVRIGNEFRPRNRIGNLLRHHAAMVGSPGAAWDEQVAAGDSVYLPKWKASAFCNPDLGDLLAREGVQQVRICGLYARACVTATARDALRRGLRVIVMRDAVACRSDRSREAALQRLNRRGAELRYALVA